MPRKRGGGLLCGCFGGGDETPHITYDVDNGMVLHPMEVADPMPPLEELNLMFVELVDELDLPALHRERMFSLSPEKKWQIYCSKKKEQDDPNSTKWPDYYLDQLKAMMTLAFTHDEDVIAARTNLVDSLKTALRTQPMRFVMRFIELDGLSVLLEFLENMDFDLMESPIHTSVIGCIKALMNNSHGRADVLAHPTAINIVTQSMSSENIKTKIQVLEILGGVCLVPGGHRKVLTAMSHYQEYASERTRFQRLVNDLDRSTGHYREEVNLKTAILSFINAIIKYGAGEDNLEFRIHLRYEFLMLGIQPVIDKLRSLENATVDRHLDFFELVRNEDERELAKRFNMVHVDVRSANSMFEVIKKKIAHTQAYPHFLSLLQHFLLLPNKGSSIHHWSLVDRLVQQIVLQYEDGGDPDVAPFDINFKDVIEKVINQDVIRQQKAEELEKSYEELKAQLERKERELDAKNQEKEEAMSALNSIQERFDQQAAELAMSSRQGQELQAQMAELKAMIASGKLGAVSLSDDDMLKVDSLKSPASLSGQPAPPPPPAAPFAPPPPPGMGPPAPPPPPGQGGPPPPPGMGGMMAKKKNYPKPSNPLKSFNWAKLPDLQLQGTIWTELDGMKILKIMDLTEFDKVFSAYQKVDTDGETGFSFKSSKRKELSVIDGRRAQNCTILLSKLKLTNEEITKAVLSMDQGEDIPKDMLEQLLKYVPTPEEVALVKEHERELDSVARADRFLYEMGKINHYEQRLKCLYFKKKFQERMGECKPKVEAVLKASKELSSSKRLRKVLEIILAFGNYMNRGPRGNASGFRISSLNKILDTKSSLSKHPTLLHYLTAVLEKKFPDVFKLEEELASLRDASKVNMGELDKDINIIGAGLKEVEKELDFQKNRPSTEKGDKFVSVMSDFKTVSSISFSKIRDLQAQAKEKITKCIKQFGEDPAKMTAEEFFSTFDAFVQSFIEAKIDNENMRKKQEEEEKRARIEAERVARERKRKASKKENQNGRKQGGEGEFDDLISALRTGDMFGEDVAKMKRNRKRQSQPAQPAAANGSNGRPKMGEVSRERVGKPKPATTPSSKMTAI
ncbi:disheveled-associated activator of morphogenesis 1-A-like isoform X2 [Acanthaster planci]|uniref:Disheveled-associated activator of morphogenesis 1-A-like isoform X2 n=1 Tax=Acanthaster planci TaxID=133434 RepID=A0A8B7Z1S5_ACAPL|nr:disheveled-associated activator of morphogenesis 1-A-like isoform X2 [Acanthaster planci]